MDKERCRELLDQNYCWPCDYIFKFIVPKKSLSQLADIFPQESTTLKESKNGNYISVTVKLLMNSSDEVLEKYDGLSGIEGLISL